MAARERAAHTGEGERIQTSGNPAAEPGARAVPFGIESQTDRGQGLALFLVLFACYSYFVQPLGPNELTRYFSIIAVVEDSRLDIDRYASLTPDRAYYAGHYYSDKAPGVFLEGLPIYFIERVVLGGAPSERLAVYALQIPIVALPSAFLGLLVWRTAGRLGARPRRACLVALVFGLATIAFSFATMLFGHQPASFFAFAAFYLLFRARQEGASKLSLFASGLLAGLAALVEYPVGIVGALLLVYVVSWLRPRGRAVLYLAGGVPVALALGAYNWLYFGSPFHLGYAFVDNPDFAAMQLGLLGVTYPRPMSVLEILVGPRGLFFLSPFLVLGCWGLVRMLRSPDQKPEGRLFVGIVAAFVLYNSAYYAPIGHWSLGPRFLVPMLPYLAIPVVYVLRQRSQRRLFAILAAISLGQVWIGTLVDPKVPTMYAFPLTQLYLPGLWKGRLVETLGNVVGLRGAWALLPLAAVVGVGVLFLLLRDAGNTVKRSIS